VICISLAQDSGGRYYDNVINFNINVSIDKWWVHESAPSANKLLSSRTKRNGCATDSKRLFNEILMACSIASMEVDVNQMPVVYAEGIYKDINAKRNNFFKIPTAEEYPKLQYIFLHCFESVSNFFIPVLLR
jgi:hypothetical protein